MRNFIQSLVCDESGVTAVEYAILAGIVVGILGIAGSGFGTALSTAFGNLATKLTTNTTP